MARVPLLCLAVLVVSSPLIAGIMGGSDEYLVIVNESGSELVVSYRVGEFAGPDFERYVMLNKPMRSPSGKYTRTRKYWRLTEDQMMLDGGILTFSISPNTGVMVGGIWRGAGVGAGADEALDDTPRLVIEGPEETTRYVGENVLAAFDRFSRDLRMLVVD